MVAYEMSKIGQPKAASQQLAISVMNS